MINIKNNNMVREKKEQQCLVSQYTNAPFFSQRSDGTTITYFEDFTNKHNIAGIDIANISQSTLTIIIDTRDGKTIERSIQVADPLTDNPIAERNFQVEDVCRISIRSESEDPLFIGAGFLAIFMTFYNSCPNVDSSKKNNCGCPKA